MKFTIEESAMLSEKFKAYCADPESRSKDFSELFGDEADDIMKGIVLGVDDFYSLYTKDITPQTIRDRLDTAAADMKTPAEKYTYLANVMTAITQLIGSTVDNRVWAAALDEHAEIMKALSLGNADIDDETITERIEEMEKLISESIDECSVLFVEQPSYEELFEACKVEQPETIKAMAVNTRESSVNMAAALYVLQEQDKLPSLGEKILPRSMGIMAATIGEIDAAQKEESPKTAQSKITKALKAAAALMASAPDLLKNGMFVGFVALFTKFSAFWTIIAGAVCLINMESSRRTNSKSIDSLIEQGEKFIKNAPATLEKVKKNADKFTEWVRSAVIPRVYPKWEELKEYTEGNILLPAAHFIMTAKDKIRNAADIAFEKIQSAYDRLKESVKDFIKKASEYSSEKGSGYDVHVGGTDETEDEDESEDETENEYVDEYVDVNLAEDDTDEDDNLITPDDIVTV